MVVLFNESSFILRFHHVGLPPQLQVPSLRFVQAGVFVVMAQSFKHVKSSDVAPDRTFIIEEQIDVPEGDSFTKFIHNGSAEPNLLPDDPAYWTCLFLCPCQHLQYEKTHHLAFVSDLQGCNGLLTDAQIMTSPCVFCLFKVSYLFNLSTGSYWKPFMEKGLRRVHLITSQWYLGKETLKVVLHISHLSISAMNSVYGWTWLPLKLRSM